MFGLSFEKLFVLVLIALFVLGPERLPAAATWLGQNVRRIKAFAANAGQQLRDEVGPEFEHLREPLEQLRGPLQELRSLRDPRAAVMRHLLDEPSSGATAPAVPARTSGPRSAPPFDADAT